MTNLASIGTSAQSPDATFLLQFVLAAVLIGNVISIWIGVLNRKNIQKREVTFEFTPASKEVFDNHVRANREEHDQLHAKISGLDRGSRDRLETTVRDFNAKIQGLPGEIIALLRNTGVIK